MHATTELYLVSKYSSVHATNVLLCRRFIKKMLVCHFSAILHYEVDSSGGNVRPSSVRPSVRPSTKSLSDFNEIWYVYRGR